MTDNQSKLGALAETTTVAEIMTKSISTLTPKDSVETALRAMVDEINTLPVIDNAGRCIGMISRADLSESFFEEDRELTRMFESAGTGFPLIPTALVDTCSERRVNEFMSDDVRVATTATSITQACNILASGNFHHLPVVDESETLVGIVSMSDIIGWLAQ